MLEQLLAASGDGVARVGDAVERTDWRLFRGINLHPGVQQQWLAMLEGLLSVHNRFLALTAEENGEVLRLAVTRSSRG